MKKAIWAAVLSATVFSSFSVLAESEVEAWYTSKGNEYLVRDSIHGDLYALLGIAKSGKPYVYIIMFDSDCEESSGDVISHNPIYVNGTLTRYQQYCSGKRRYFMPATEAGRSHIVKEFMLRNFVEIKTHDESARFLFSAKGFSDFLQKLKLEQKGI